MLTRVESGDRTPSVAKPLFQSVRGMHDILPEESTRWETVERAFREVVGLYNYGEVRIPVLEATDLFTRSIGDETDIVGKEMYSFTDTGGDALTLRPEGTAGAVRAYVEHAVGALEPVTKWYYLGPMFRRERPQKGRYRQFHQAGAEAFGAPPPLVDAEQVVMLADFLGRVGLEATILWNHLGGRDARERYRARLVSHYEAREERLCDDCRRRLRTNPLRLLDCKVGSCVEMKADAPGMRESLGEEDLSTMDRFRALAAAGGVRLREEERLVRGLDYYTGIVYEAEVMAAGGPVVVAGGGRYDELVGRLGGPETLATGFAIGLERVVECMQASGPLVLDLFVLVPSSEAEVEAARIVGEARRAGIRVDVDPRGGSVKAQMKRAHKLGARLVAILGEEETSRGKVSVKEMEKGDQVEVPAGDLVGHVLGRLGR